MGVKGNWINFIFSINSRKDYSESIFQSISFHNKLSVGNPMSEDRSEGKYLLKRIESIMTGGVKLPRNVLLDEVLSRSLMRYLVLFFL